jgi:hypothetical protein
MFHPRFVAILQIVYQNNRLAYSSNQIDMTFDLENKTQHVNWCIIVITHMLVKLIRWIKRQKKIVACLALGNNKVVNCYLTSLNLFHEASCYTSLKHELRV